MLILLWFRKQLIDRWYDKPCKRCGQIISFSRGEADCKICYGKNDSELKIIKANLDKDNQEVANLGVVFIIVALGLLLITLALFV